MSDVAKHIPPYQVRSMSHGAMPHAIKFNKAFSNDEISDIFGETYNELYRVGLIDETTDGFLVVYLVLEHVQRYFDLPVTRGNGVES